jgi:hypothetical protein
MPFDGTEINATTARLIKGRELIQNEGWCSKGEGEPSSGPHCVVAAIVRCDRLDRLDGDMPALEAFAEANGIKVKQGRVGIQIGKWNDAAGRTLEEIYTAFDRAIAFAIRA